MTDSTSGLEKRLLPILYWESEDRGRLILENHERKRADSDVRRRTAYVFLGGIASSAVLFKMGGMIAGLIPFGIIIAFRMVFFWRSEAWLLHSLGMAELASVPANKVRARWRDLVSSSPSSVRYRLWRWLVFIRPFGFQNIWWWTLCFSLLTVTVPEMTSQSIEGLLPLEARILASLVIASIAYISTNIISQLLDLRDDYGKVTDQVQSASGIVQEMGDKVEDHIGALHRIAGEADQALRSSLKTISASAQWLALLSDAPKREQIRKALDGVMEASYNYGFKIKQAQDSGNAGDYVASVLAELLVGQVDLLNTERLICLTSFQNLAKMSSAVVECAQALASEDEEIEIHALLVLPPWKFLEYDGEYQAGDQVNSITWQAEHAQRKLTDINWLKFLRKNAETASANGNVKVRRYFLSINPYGVLEKLLNGIRVLDEVRLDAKHLRPLGKAIREILPLHKANVEFQLRGQILCSAERVPYLYGLSNGKYVRFDSITDDDFKGEEEGWRFVAKFGASSWSGVSPIPEGSWLPVAEVIGKYFHRDGSAYVLESDDEGDAQLANILDSRRGKVKDFLAVRVSKREGGKWAFCLRSLYDQDFDVAYVEISYDGQEGDRWEKIAGELDLLFGQENGEGLKRHLVEEYANLVPS